MRLTKILLHAVLAFVIAFIILVPLVAMAQPIPPPGVAGPSIEDLLQQLLGTVSTWKASGWLAGCVAAVNVISNLMKYKPLADALDKTKFGWWMRPAISVLLGIVAAMFAKVAGGVPWGVAILIALVSGLASTGFHELMVAIFDNRVQAERAAGSRIVELLKGTEAEAAAKVGPVTAELSKIAALPSENVRLMALADWANSNPPASAVATAAAVTPTGITPVVPPKV